MDMQATSRAKRAELSLVVIRADGRRDELGTVAHSGWWWNHGPARLLAWWRIKRANRKVRDG